MIRTPNRRRPRPGTTLVETAMVLSLLLLFLFGIFEYGRYLMVTQCLSNAARDGVRYASTNVDKSNSFVTVDEGGRMNITDYTKSQCQGVDKMISSFAVQVFPCSDAELFQDPPVVQPKATYTSWNEAAFTGRLAVRITGIYRPVLPVVWLPGPGGGMKTSFYGSGNTVPLTITAICGSEG